jgi:Zn-dependent protease
MASIGVQRKARQDRQDRGSDPRFLLYILLHTIGFLAVTLLMTWGAFVLLFVAIGGFSLDGMMHQLANLSTRYVAAEASRTADFKVLVAVLHLIVAGVIIFFRRHTIVPRDTLSLEQGA